MDLHQIFKDLEPQLEERRQWAAKTKEERLKYCCQVDNVIAYRIETGMNYDDCERLYNFTPLTDKWCLYCNKKDCKYRCSGCRSVYFCSPEHQKEAWPIHRKHCGRNLFTLCIMCGKSDTKLKCDSYPVKFCSLECKNQIYKDHCEIDCKNLQKFNNF